MFFLIDQNKRNRIPWKAAELSPWAHRPAVNDEKGFGCHVEATVFQGLVVAEGEVTSFVLWVLGDAEVKPHGGFGGDLHVLGFVELIWGERTEPGCIGKGLSNERLGCSSSTTWGQLLNPSWSKFLHLLSVSSSPPRKIAKIL